MNRRESLKLLGSAALRQRELSLREAGARPGATRPTARSSCRRWDMPFDALEPHIDAQTMMIHHDRHHAAYVNTCNTIRQGGARSSAPRRSNRRLPTRPTSRCRLQQQVKNNLGGHWNHSFFWELMTPGGAKEPSGELKSAIEGSWKDVNEFKEKLNAAGAARFGSGWAWLVVNKDKKLELISTANQDTPIALGAKAVIGVDVWEHAYYLKYQNRRPDYLKAWWNTVNWDKAAENFKKATA